GHTGLVESVAISPDGTWLATTSDDGTARIWDLAGNCTATLTGHSGFVESVAISPDGTWLATTSDDGTARIWDLAGNCTATLTGHTESVESVAISPDGTWLATTSRDGMVCAWSVEERRTVAVMRVSPRLFSCAWGTGRVLAVGGDRGVYLFDFQP
ncbi:WD40 repeat domain-containing protein, partial [Streptomyces buecherae]|uniref:WD40 repeat domain-containing protein n=1 Tax=Streptomyces buecherae TaxID=2763006 RepID=UPI003664AF9C